MDRITVSNNGTDLYPADVDPDGRHQEGWYNPHFDLDAVRRLAENTQRAAVEPGNGAIDTVHVIEGDEDGDPPAIVAVISWADVDAMGTDGATTIVTPIRLDDPDGDDPHSLRWPVGGFAWCWYAINADGNAELPTKNRK